LLLLVILLSQVSLSFKLLPDLVFFNSTHEFTKR